jgi:hypothetical protein
MARSISAQALHALDELNPVGENYSVPLLSVEEINGKGLDTRFVLEKYRVLALAKHCGPAVQIDANKWDRVQTFRCHDRIRMMAWVCDAAKEDIQRLGDTV